MISRTDHIGIVVTNERTTLNLHLPIVVTNMSKKPGVITLAQIIAIDTETQERKIFEWSLFWRFSENGSRESERRSAPIPVAGLTNIERNIQFACTDDVQWQPHLYEFTLELHFGKTLFIKKRDKFYTKPSADHCNKWYKIGSPANPEVHDLAIYPSKAEVPKEGC